MEPLYTPEQMRNIDRHLIDDVGVAGIALMETAAHGVFEAAMRKVSAANHTSVIVLCGPGNNGGDGLAVLRLLKEADIFAEGILFCEPAEYRGDAAEEYRRAFAADCVMHQATKIPISVPNNAIVIDAMFGTGLTREITGKAAAWINAVNASDAYVIAVDIPSGINGTTGQMLGCAVAADETVTFQHWKPGLLLYPGKQCAGEIRLHRISPADTVETCTCYWQNREDVAAWLPPRANDSHKGKNGRALMLVGSETYTGAALLSAGAALRCGCGLLTVGVPGRVKPAFCTLPEVMCVPLADGKGWTEQCCKEAKGLIGGQQAIAMGCGMGEIADPSLINAVLASEIPLVLDADALNLLAKHEELQCCLHKKVVLTPHAGEMARLLRCKVSDVTADPAAIARCCARNWNCIVLLKGATTCISDGETVVFNTSGNAGLAKGGSGDTLTGIITALLAQGVSPMNAACAGAFLLGASADVAFEVLGNRMLVASDLIDVVRQTIGQIG